MDKVKLKCIGLNILVILKKLFVCLIKTFKSFTLISLALFPLLYVARFIKPDEFTYTDDTLINVAYLIYAICFVFCLFITSINKDTIGYTIEKGKVIPESARENIHRNIDIILYNGKVINTNHLVEFGKEFTVIYDDEFKPLRIIPTRQIDYWTTVEENNIDFKENYLKK